MDEIQSNNNIFYEFNGVNVQDFLIDNPNHEAFFSDVIGLEDQKAIVKRDYLDSNKRHSKNFILLYGLPGTGKTLFADAFINELRSKSENQDMPFFVINCGKLKSPFVGATENNIIALFEFTKQFERCVIFLDDFEAIGLSRNKAGDDYCVLPTIKTLLYQLQDVSSKPGILILAATSRPYDIDNELLAQTYRIETPLPSATVLLNALQKKLGNLIEKDVDLPAIAKRLEREHYAIYDFKKLIDEASNILIEANKVDPGINYLNKEMMEDALSKAKSTIRAEEIAAIEQFKKQYL